MLEKIKTPEDIRKLSAVDLKILASDVRKRIIEVTSKNGGHLAPSLGATDLIIALLHEFDPLLDRIVFDVGHQSYAFKILTERNDRFETLRQFNGISGFNNTFESPYDAFSVGHSSTSVSATLGICVGKEMTSQQGRSIAIIGDGALTGGMAFEGLNHSGHLQKNMIVILNDNEMSISRNVGALQKYLTSLLTSRSYNFIKKQVWDLSQNLPENIRRRFIFGAQKLEESLINILVPNILFEDLGFKYVGPVDGHDIPKLIQTFQKVKQNMIGPIFIHILTHKGKGYRFAESNATKFHGIGPYVEQTGQTISASKVSYSKQFGTTLCELAEKQSNIVAITAAMSDGTGLTEFEKLYPKRFFDVGIAEQHAVTFAAGLATQGLKPFIAIYSTFLQRALDQVIHDVAIQKLPLVFCLDRAGLVGEDGATHHGAFDLSYLHFIPEMMVMMPGNAEELSLMLAYAASYTEGPCAIRYPRGPIHETKYSPAPIVKGKSQILHQGEGIAIIAAGTSLATAIELRELISNHYPKINPTLVNARFLKPFDIETLEELKKSHTEFITIEENAVYGGFGSALQRELCNSPQRVHCYGLPDSFVTYGTNAQLFELLGLTPEKILADLVKNSVI